MGPKLIPQSTLGAFSPLGVRDNVRPLHEMDFTYVCFLAETQIKVSEVLKLTEQKPLITTRFPTKSGTHWIVFYKEEA